MFKLDVIEINSRLIVNDITVSDNREMCDLKSSIISFCSSKLKAVFILMQCSLRKQVVTDNLPYEGK